MSVHSLSAQLRPYSVVEMALARLDPSEPAAAVTPAATALLPVTAADDAHFATVSTVFHLSRPGDAAACAPPSALPLLLATALAAPPHSSTGALVPAPRAETATAAVPVPDTLDVVADAELRGPALAAESLDTASCGGLPVGLGAAAASSLPVGAAPDATYGLTFSAALQQKNERQKACMCETRPGNILRNVTAETEASHVIAYPPSETSAAVLGSNYKSLRQGFSRKDNARGNIGANGSSGRCVSRRIGC